MLSEEEQPLAAALSETLFAYELEHRNLEKPFSNIWIEKYTYGEKQEEEVVYNSQKTEAGEDEQLYISFQATGIDGQERLINIIRANEEA